MAYDFRYSKANLESLVNQLVFSPLESHEVAYRKHGASHSANDTMLYETDVGGGVEHW